MAAYLRSTDGKTAKNVDYDMSDKGPAEWMVLICEEFNKQSNKYFTQIMISLHDNFAEAIGCDEGEFQLTPDKCKAIFVVLQPMQVKL
jgi:translation initiation factor 2 alpha subunit (eIF-2alpha)